jgi:hypothetical protein
MIVTCVLMRLAFNSGSVLNFIFNFASGAFENSRAPPIRSSRSPNHRSLWALNGDQPSSRLPAATARLSHGEGRFLRIGRGSGSQLLSGHKSIC